jgi:hypothetical protein
LLDNAASDGALLLGFGEFEHGIRELMSTLSAQYSVTPFAASKFKTNNRSTTIQNTPTPPAHTQKDVPWILLSTKARLSDALNECARGLFMAARTHTPSTAAPKISLLN